MKKNKSCKVSKASLVNLETKLDTIIFNDPSQDNKDLLSEVKGWITNISDTCPNTQEYKVAYNYVTSEYNKYK